MLTSDWSSLISHSLPLHPICHQISLALLLNIPWIYLHFLHIPLLLLLFQVTIIFCLDCLSVYLILLLHLESISLLETFQWTSITLRIKSKSFTTFYKVLPDIFFTEPLTSSPITLFLSQCASACPLGLLHWFFLLLTILCLWIFSWLVPSHYSGLSSN